MATSPLLTNDEYDMLNEVVRDKAAKFYTAMGALLQNYKHNSEYTESERKYKVNKYVRDTKGLNHFERTFGRYEKNANSAKRKLYTNARNASAVYNALRPGGKEEIIENYWRVRAWREAEAERKRAAANDWGGMAKGGTRHSKRSRKRSSGTKKRK